MSDILLQFHTEYKEGIFVYFIECFKQAGILRVLAGVNLLIFLNIFNVWGFVFFLFVFLLLFFFVFVSFYFFLDVIILIYFF